MAGVEKNQAASLDQVVAAALIELRSFTYRRRRIFGLRLEKRDKSLFDEDARSGAIHIFKHMKFHGYPYTPDAVHSWAVANGWRTLDAYQLADYAEGILAGKRYHTAPDPFGMYAIERWRQQAQANQPSVPVRSSPSPSANPAD